MADPRLQWRSLAVAQPNVAGLMRGANDSLMAAGEAAKGILTSYQEGAELKAENELARRIGGRTQEELTQMFNSGAFDDLNLGDSGLSTLNSAISGRAGVDNTNSIVRDRDGRLTIARNQDSRAGEEFGWARDDRGRLVQQRNWMEDNAGIFLDSERGALNDGTAFSASMSAESGGASDQYDAILGHAQRENGIRVSQMTLGELNEFSQGAYAEQSKEWKRANGHGDASVPSTPMGKYQIVGQTLRGIINNFDLPADLQFTPGVQDQMGTYLAQQRIAGAGSRAEARNALRSEWEAYKGKSDAELDAVIDDISSRPPVTRESIITAGTQGGQGGTQPSRNRGFGGDSFANSMADSGIFTPQEILAGVTPLRTAGAEGDKLNEQERLQLQNDILASVMSDTASNPEITTPVDYGMAVQDAALASGQFTEAEAMAARRQAEAGLAEGTLATQLAPVVEEDVRFGNIIEGTNEDIQRGLESTIIGRMENDIATFQEAESVTAALEEALGPSLQENAAGPVGSFLSPGRGGADSNDITNLINRYAAKFDVTPEVAAAAMREAFVDDPLTFAGFGANTLERRFDEDRVGEIIGQYTNQEAQSQFGDDSRLKREFDQQLSQLNKDVIDLQQRAAKTKDPAKRKEIQEEIAKIFFEMSSIRSEAQGLYRGGTTPSQKQTP